MYAWDVLSEFFEVSKYCSNAFKNREHMLPGTKTPPQMAPLILLKPQPIWSVSVHYMVLLNVSNQTFRNKVWAISATQLEASRPTHCVDPIRKVDTL